MATMDAIRPEAILPEISLDVPFSRVAMVSPASWDYFPGHHDPDYARAQGKRSIYLNTMALGAFLDRVATDWLGPDWFIRGRVLRMQQSVCAGDILQAGGVVTAVNEEAGKIRDVVVDVTGRTANGICVTAQITLEPPGSRGHAG